MMAYIFLLINATAQTFMSLLRKEFDKRNRKSILSSVLFAGVVYAIIFAACMLMFLVSGSFGAFSDIDLFIVLDGAGYAFVSVVTTILCIVAASYGSVSLIVIFARLGNLVIAFVFGLAVDGNSANLFKWLGLAVAFLIILINFTVTDRSDASCTPKGRRIYALFCLAVFFTNGSSIVFYRMFTKYRPNFPALHFVSVYAALAVLIAMIAVILIRVFKKKAEQSVSFDARSKLIILVYAGILFSGEFVSLLNTAILPIIIQAPVSFALPIIFITVCERAVYKTPITRPLLVRLALAMLYCVLFVI